MSIVGFLVTVLLAGTAGGVLAAMHRDARDARIAKALAPHCRICRDTGACATNELRPRVLFCNMCELGQALERRATGNQHHASVTRLRRTHRPDGGAA